MLRRLYTWLAANCDARTLRALEWHDFHRGGAPTTSDARILAAAAVFHLLTDGNGRQIRHDDAVIYAVLGFVESERGGQRPTQVSHGLVRILQTEPVTSDNIRRWFLETYT